VPEWVYGVVDGDAPGPDSEAGVDGAPVRLIRGGAVAALASAVPIERFGEDALKESLEDLEQLEELARAHQETIDRALARGPVIPFRMCTIYADGDGVRAMLAREQESLATALDRLRGAAEWGVKAYRAQLEPAGSAAAARSGTEWLRRKRDDRAAAESARAATDERAAAIHAALAGQARAATLARPHDRRLSGDEREMVLNGAYLVPVEQAEAFRALVDELGRVHEPHGLQLELTGPWAPYHFVGNGA
jgi:Gas vesicle synthesis protein GvpL/GvpF